MMEQLLLFLVIVSNAMLIIIVRDLNTKIEILEYMIEDYCSTKINNLNGEEDPCRADRDSREV